MPIDRRRVSACEERRVIAEQLAPGRLERPARQHACLMPDDDPCEQHFRAARRRGDADVRIHVKRRAATVSPRANDFRPVIHVRPHGASENAAPLGQEVLRPDLLPCSAPFEAPAVSCGIHTNAGNRVRQPVLCVASVNESSTHRSYGEGRDRFR